MSQFIESVTVEYLDREQEDVMIAWDNLIQVAEANDGHIGQSHQHHPRQPPATNPRKSGFWERLEKENSG